MLQTEVTRYDMPWIDAYKDNEPVYQLKSTWVDGDGVTRNHSIMLPTHPAVDPTDPEDETIISIKDHLASFINAHMSGPNHSTDLDEEIADYKETDLDEEIADYKEAMRSYLRMYKDINLLYPDNSYNDPVIMIIKNVMLITNEFDVPLSAFDDETRRAVLDTNPDAKYIRIEWTATLLDWVNNEDDTYWVGLTSINAFVHDRESFAWRLIKSETSPLRIFMRYSTPLASTVAMMQLFMKDLGIDLTNRRDWHGIIDNNTIYNDGLDPDFNGYTELVKESH